jgi:hypothetical protein
MRGIYLKIIMILIKYGKLHEIKLPHEITSQMLVYTEVFCAVVSGANYILLSFFHTGTFIVVFLDNTRSVILPMPFK